MAEVTISELRKRGGKVIDLVASGERVVVKRHGKAVAELRPLGAGPQTAAELVRRWRRLRPLDVVAVRADVDGAVDPSL